MKILRLFLAPALFSLTGCDMWTGAKYGGPVPDMTAGTLYGGPPDLVK